MKNNNNSNSHTENNRTKAGAVIGLALVLLFLHEPRSHAANVVFSFSTANANGMDLFATSSGALITGSTGYFALGYVSSSYNFSAKTVNDILNDITILGSSSTANWGGVGTTAPANTGGKVDSFSTPDIGIDTSLFVGSKILAIVGKGATFSSAAGSEVAIVSSSSGSGLTAWSVAAPDLSLTPVTMVLGVSDFNQIYAGTYTASVGSISGGVSRYDTIAIPEPSSASLLALGMAGLVALRIRRKS